MKKLTLALLVATAAIATVTSARAELSCYSDPEGVRSDFPGRYPAWTNRMPKHKGERCWWPAPDKYHLKWKNEYADLVPEVARSKVNTRVVKHDTVKTAPVPDIMANIPITPVTTTTPSPPQVPPTPVKTNEKKVRTVTITPDVQLTPVEAAEGLIRLNTARANLDPNYLSDQRSLAEYADRLRNLMSNKLISWR